MANKRSIVFIALLAILVPGVFFAAGQGDGEETVVIKLSDQVNEQNPHFLAHQFFAERVAELSEGSVEVQVFPNSQLGDARESLEGTLTGIVEAAKVSAGQLNAYSSAFSIFSLPYVFTNKEQVFAALDGEVGEILTDELEKHGFQLLAFYDTGFRSIFNKVRPIYEPEDLEGLKIRVINDPVMIDTINSLGGLATPLAYAELYTSLQQGVVDGGEQPPVALYAMKFYEVSEYFSLTNHFYDLNVLVMSKDFFENRLSPAQQGAVMQAAVETQVRQRELWAEYEGEVIAQIEATGMEVNELDLAPFRNAVSHIIDEQRSVVGEDVMDAALRYSSQ